MKRIMIVIGTRPETIKMAPIFHALSGRAGMEVMVCSTGQHRHILDQMMNFFDISPNYELYVMTPNQDLFDVTSKVLVGMRDVLRNAHPDLVLVQGDTTTVLAVSLAAFYLNVPVGHVEAGLRTWKMRNPFPEEGNRWIADVLSTLHFAPTENNRKALLQCGIQSNRIHVTGNTVIDALLFTLDRLGNEPFAAVDLSQMEYVIALTTHRRESFGAPIKRTFQAIASLVLKYPQLNVVYPAHPNPRVQEAIIDCLSGVKRVHILSPQSYPEFVKLMRDAHIILTDSGGVQEEAPSLGKPVLVLRDTTERPEGVAAGTAKLVGTNLERIVHEVSLLIDDPKAYGQMAEAVNPYGNGNAAQCIADIIETF